MDTDILAKAITPKSALFSAMALAILWAAYPSRTKSKAPMVSYRYPIVGSTSDYIRNPEGFAREMIEKYGPASRIYLKGQVQTAVSSSELIKKVFAADAQLNFLEALKETFDTDVVFGFPKNRDTNTVIKLISKHLVPNLGKYVPRMEAQLRKALGPKLEEIKDSEAIPNLYWILSDAVSRSSASAFVGAELCENEELIRSFQTLTLDVGVVLSPKGIFEHFPGIWAQWNKFRFKFSPPCSKHLEVIKRVVMPVIEKRRRERAELGDAWERPDDLLQYLIEEESPDPSVPVDFKLIAANIFGLVFASIHTTTMFSTVVLTRLASHPECIEPLREELNSVFSDPSFADEEGFTMAKVKRLVKLDSFMRETFRLHTETLMLPHKNVSGEALDFGNGIIVNPGENVLINVMEERLRPETQGPNPEMFDPWRFVGKGKTSTKVGTDMMLFGMGKHACPGRFIAATSIKLIISIIIKDHDIGMDGGVVVLKRVQ